MPSPAPGPTSERIEILLALIEAWPRVGALAPAERAALEAIVTAPLAWSWLEPPAEPTTMKAVKARLAALGVRPAESAAWLAGLAAAGHEAGTLAALEDAGLVAPWPGPVGMAYTLTPAAAWHLGIELFEYGDEDDPASAWRPIDPRPRGVKLSRRFGACDQGLLEQLTDSALGPDEVAELAEEVSRRRVPTEPVLDPWSGEALVLFAGPDGSGGVPVLRDHRRDHPMKGVPSRSMPATKPAPKARATPKPKPKPARVKAASKAPRSGPTPGPSKAAGRPRPRTPATPTPTPKPGTFDLIDAHRASRKAARSAGRTAGLEAGG